nr:PlmE [Aspergillus flavipes]
MGKENLCNDHWETRLLINGEFRASSDGKRFNVTNPYTGDVLAQVHAASKDDTDEAVRAAQAAFPAWRALEPSERGAYFLRLADLVEASAGELAQLDAMDSGIPISQAMGTQLITTSLRYLAQTGWTIQGTSSTNTRDFFNYTVQEPYGVVACIGASNIPLLPMACDVAPALAAGNTVVFKTHEKDPMAALGVARLVHQAGFPPGVFNIISGFRDPVGTTLAGHMDVRCLTISGSLGATQDILVTAARSNMKHVNAHSGGGSAAIIFADGDLAQAAADTTASILSLNGQNCMANTRIFVEEAAADEFNRLLRKQFAQSIRPGNPVDPATTLGPSMDDEFFALVGKAIEAAHRDGRVVVGGEMGEVAGGRLFVQPTIVEDVASDSLLMQAQAWGPVVVVNRFETEEDGVRMSNAYPFGLYAAVYTRDSGRVHRLVRQLDVGNVAVNCAGPTMAFDLPFGGRKLTGGASNGLLYAMGNYLQNKAVLWKTS